MEALKQEYLLAKIDRLIKQIEVVDDHNIAAVVNIERHYLVANKRLQAALTELDRLKDPAEPFLDFSSKGKITIKDMML